MCVAALCVCVANREICTGHNTEVSPASEDARNGHSADNGIVEEEFFSYLIFLAHRYPEPTAGVLHLIVHIDQEEHQRQHGMTEDDNADDT